MVIQPWSVLPPRYADKISPEPNTGCWLWTASIFPNGYGWIMKPDQRGAGAHRVIYEFLHGPIGAGLTLDHTCRVRCCVNPDHLDPVPQRENLLRGHSIQAACAKQTHCINGHPFSGTNLIYKKKGKAVFRACRICRRASTQARRDRLNGKPRSELIQLHRDRATVPRRCRHGHILKGENLKYDPHGYRYCLMCRRDADRRRRGGDPPL